MTLYDWYFVGGFLFGFAAWLILDALNHKFGLTGELVKLIDAWVDDQKKQRGEKL
jgi:hypothetical protein